MDMHRSLQHGIASLGVHRIKYTMYDLVAAGSEHGGAKNLLGRRVDDNLHQSARLALLDGASDARHRSRPDEHRMPSASSIRRGQPRASKWRIEVERVSGNAIRHAANAAVKQIGRND